MQISFDLVKEKSPPETWELNAVEAEKYYKNAN